MQTWLRTVEDDLRPLNFGLATARRCAKGRPAWRLLVDAGYVFVTRYRETESVGVNGTPSHSYGVSLAIWDHTLLPTTRHK